ncbi:hypothetical protein ABFS82_14G274000 [Erythranthe guttata]
MMMMNSGSTQSEEGDEEEFIIDDSNSNSEYSISSLFNPSSSSSTSNTHQNTTTTFHPHHNDHLFWSAGLTSHQTTTPDSAVRKNPKKRSRVSNRNPTTVLTTDTTNFRQMVQQFTGIPANPLSGGLDLFSALRPGYQYLDTLYGPVHPLKPSANKNHSIINPLQLGGNASTGFGAAALISGFQTPSPTSQVKNNHNI